MRQEIRIEDPETRSVRIRMTHVERQDQTEPYELLSRLVCVDLSEHEIEVDLLEQIVQ